MDVFVERFRTLANSGAITVGPKPPALLARASMSIFLSHEDESRRFAVLRGALSYGDLFSGC